MPKPKKAWFLQADSSDTRTMLEVDQGFLNDLNRTQDNLRNTRNNGANMTMKGLGGFVRTFYFDEESNANVINSTTQIEYDIEMFREYPITVVVLENKDNSSEIGDAIVGHTKKLSGDGGDLIVQAYFSGFSHKIHKYIVAYERFTPSSIRGICNRPFFSADGLHLDLIEYWRKRMRCILIHSCVLLGSCMSFIELLYYTARCEIRHGSLLNPTSYVTCRGDMRIINKGRVFHDRYEAGKDMEDLMNLISRLFPDSLPKYDDPATVHNFRRIALGHPILLGTVLEKLECFVTLHHGSRFLNRIHRDYPLLRRFLSSNLFQDKVGSEYDFHFRRLVPYLKLRVKYDYETPYGYPVNEFLYDLRYNDWSPRYGERYIYINIIRLVQNLIKHGAEYCEQYGNLNNLLTKIKTRFSHNMCACYTLLNIKKDWINETSSEPYLSNCWFIHVSIFTPTEMM
ncbi:hypothetical protein VPH35_055769 [Triticum aestivum]